MKQWLIDFIAPFYYYKVWPFMVRYGLVMLGGGKDGDDPPPIDPRIAQYSAEARFRPFSLTTSAGRSSGGNDGQFQAQASQPFSNIQQQSLAGTQQLLPQLTGALQRQPGQLDFNTNADELTQQYFQQQSQLLQPQFEQQANQLQNTLFGSGRMGLQLAGEAVGAGSGGMVQPDAFGLARAQSQTLADVGAQSRQRALQDAQQRFALERGQLTTNEALQQQQLQNLLGGTQGLFGMGQSVADIERQLMALGLTAEQARGAASAQAAQGLLGNRQAEMQNFQASQDSGKGIGGSLLGAAAGSFIPGVGTALGSSIGSKIGGSLFGGGGGGGANSSLTGGFKI